MTPPTPKEPEAISELRSGLAGSRYESCGGYGCYNHTWHMADVLSAYDAMKNERDAWEHRAEVAERENGEALAMLAFTGETSLWQAAAATRAKLAEAEKDAARLDWMADDPPFDGIGNLDLYDFWHMVAHENGHEEATQEDKRAAFRLLLDTARTAATAQGE